MPNAARGNPGITRRAQWRRSVVLVARSVSERSQENCYLLRPPFKLADIVLGVPSPREGERSDLGHAQDEVGQAGPWRSVPADMGGAHRNGTLSWRTSPPPACGRATQHQELGTWAAFGPDYIHSPVCVSSRPPPKQLPQQTLVRCSPISELLSKGAKNLGEQGLSFPSSAHVTR